MAPAMKTTMPVASAESTNLHSAAPNSIRRSSKYVPARVYSTGVQERKKIRVQCGLEPPTRGLRSVPSRGNKRMECVRHSTQAQATGCQPAISPTSGRCGTAIHHLDARAVFRSKILKLLERSSPLRSLKQPRADFRFCRTRMSSLLQLLHSILVGATREP